MPYTVLNLIESHSEPVVAKPTDPIKEALEHMIEHDFSQLPVVDESFRPMGMVTNESILRAILNFGVGPDQLLVSDAITKASAYHPEDDLFDLLDRLKESNAVLIVDGEERLVGIVTSFDSNEYFRRRSEDMMLVEDIESWMKDLIQGAYVDEAGEIDLSKLKLAIDEITNLNKDLFKRFAKSLSHYLHLQGSEKPDPNSLWLEESFAYLVKKGKTKEFEELTFNEYMDLLLRKETWELYRSIFGINLEANALRMLLNEVRDMRNALAHFKSEITPMQRDRLKFCVDWLSRHQRPIQLKLPVQAVDKEVSVEDYGKGSVTLIVSSAVHAHSVDNVEIAPVDEQIAPGDSRYAALAVFLHGQPGSIDRIQLTFEQVEEVIDAPLPESARRHRSWWANDSTSHTQALQWLDVGWRVSYINLTEETVTFARIKEREKAYIHFFSAMLTELRKVKDYPLKRVSPDGQSWIVVSGLPENGRQQAAFAYSFTRDRRFRAELYIDTGDQSNNKQVFDDIHQRKTEIEQALGFELAWERLDEKRASRIACYHRGVITNSSEQLKELRTWAVETMPRFYAAISMPAQDALMRVRDE